MNYIKITLVIALHFLAFVSCSNESGEYVDPQNRSSDINRVQFKNEKSFLNTWTLLSTMSKKDLSSWIDKNNISLSKNNYKNPTIDDDRDYFRALFDSNNELQIGDSIIWYNDGLLLLVSENANEQEAKANKSNPLKCTVYGKIEKQLIEEGTDDTEKLKGSMGSSTSYPSLQYTFPSPIKPGYLFKYVYQLYTYKNTVATNTVYELVYVNKLEWKKSSSFKEASEVRVCKTKLTGLVTIEVAGTGIQVNRQFSVDYNRTDELQYNSGLVLARTAYPNGYHTFQRWTFNLNCDITQELKGYPATSKREIYAL